MVNFMLAILFIALTVATYFSARKFYQKVTYPFTLPIVVSTVVLVCFLLIFQIPYETYQLGGEWIEKLLGPAVVALAIPLYKQIELCKKYFVPIIVGVFSGAIVGMFSGFYLTKWFGLEDVFIYLFRAS